MCTVRTVDMQTLQFHVRRQWLISCAINAACPVPYKKFLLATFNALNQLCRRLARKGGQGNTEPQIIAKVAYQFPRGRQTRPVSQSRLRFAFQFNRELTFIALGIVISSRSLESLRIWPKGHSPFLPGRHPVKDCFARHIRILRKLPLKKSKVKAIRLRFVMKQPGANVTPSIGLPEPSTLANKSSLHLASYGGGDQREVSILVRMWRYEYVKAKEDRY